MGARCFARRERRDGEFALKLLNWIVFEIGYKLDARIARLTATTGKIALGAGGKRPAEQRCVCDVSLIRLVRFFWRLEGERVCWNFPPYLFFFRRGEGERGAEAYEIVGRNGAACSCFISSF